jgi:16S rRNA (cytidine1402-2'-O)-methyltransferase
LFVGFLPPRAGARRATLETLRAAPWTLVFYEAPHRIGDTIADLASNFGGERRVLLARELTKMHEQAHVCLLKDAATWIGSDANRERGEFVLAIEASATPAVAQSAVDVGQVLTALLAELPLKQAVQLAAQITGEPRNALYEQALRLKNTR